MTKTHNEALMLAQAAWYNGNSDYADPEDNAYMQAAIRAYLDARGLVMVPKDATIEMINAGLSFDPVAFPSMSTAVPAYILRLRYLSMISVAPDPFKDVTP